MSISRGTLAHKPLPMEAQLSLFCGIEISDVNSDGEMDLVMAGNFYDVLPELGRYDASYGLVLLGLGKEQFTTPSAQASGLVAREHAG